MSLLQPVAYFFDHLKCSTKYAGPISPMHILWNIICSKKYACHCTLLHILWNMRNVPKNMHEYSVQGSSGYRHIFGTYKMFHKICMSPQPTAYFVEHNMFLIICKSLYPAAYFMEHVKCSKKYVRKLHYPLLGIIQGRIFLHIQWNMRNVPKNMHNLKSR